MLGNFEKMLLTNNISSTSSNNQWPQINQIDDQKSLMIMGSTGGVTTTRQVMENNKPINQQDLQNQQAQAQAALKCPRCDSSNTKFCYYNNYSLSQPRHFCKACKRYWTRGGTLRNVPVGGGCRKNKRIKRASSSSVLDHAPSPTSSSSAPNTHSTTPNPNFQTPSNHITNPLFYGLPTNPSHDHHLNLSYPPPPPPPTRFNSRVSGFDHLDLHQPQLTTASLGLGFSSSGFHPSKQIQELVTSNNSLLSSYSIFGSSSTTSASPTMASLLASSFEQQKFFSSGLKDIREANTTFQGLVPYDHQDMQVKMEEGQNRPLDSNVPNCQNQMEQMISPSDPSPYWNSTSFGAWLDPSNIGSSVPSLI